MFGDQQEDMLQQLVESDDDLSIQSDPVEIDAENHMQHVRGAAYLSRGRRFGYNFDPERPIYRIWTNVRGTKVHIAIVTGAMIALIAFLVMREEDAEEINNVFTLHVLSMILAWLIFSEGLVAYRAGQLGSNSIQGLRDRHKRFMIFGYVCLVCGLGFILIHKNEEHHSLMPHTPHAWVGIIAIVLGLPQVRIGWIKLTQLVRGQGKKYRYHGNFGQIIYALVAINVALGFLELKGLTASGFWFFSFGFLLTSITVIAAMYQPTVFGADQFDQISPTRENADVDVEMEDYEYDTARADSGLSGDGMDGPRVISFSDRKYGQL
eukprot:m.159576 g.159576  ORF g.159576 m.159576 type:complete len:322 (-) comp31137_c0_seq2:277-1242(-)